MSKGLGEAIAEGGETAKVVAGLGLNLNQLAAEDPAKAFQQIADKIAKIPNLADRAYAEVKLFGKGGQEVGNLINLGAKGIEAFSAQADAMGVTLGGSSAEGADKATKAIERLNAALEATKRQSAIALAPLVEYLANVGVGLTAVQNAKISKADDNPFPFFSSVGKWLADNSLLVQKIRALSDVGKGIADITKNVAKISPKAPALPAAPTVSKEAAEAEKKRTDEIAKITETATKKMQEFGMSELQKTEATLKGINATSLQIDKIDRLARQLDVLTKINEEITRDNPIDAFLAKQDALRAALKAGTIDAAAFQKGLAAALAFEKNQLGAAAQEGAHILDELQTQIRDFGKTSDEKTLDFAKRLGLSPEAFGKIEAAIGKLHQLEAAAALKDLDKQIHQVGLTESEKKLDDFAAAGHTQEEIDAYAKKLDTLDALNEAQKRWNDLQEDARKNIEDLKTPLDKLNDKLAMLQEEYDSGLLSEQQFSAASERARREAAGPTKGPQLIEAGSQEALKLVGEIAGRSSGSKSPQGNDALDVARKQLLGIDRLNLTLNQKLSVGELVHVSI
jgi:hypothetical protein